MKLTWLGHSAFRLEIGQSVVLIDPFLTGSPVFKGDAVAATAGATQSPSARRLRSSRISRSACG